MGGEHMLSNYRSITNLHERLIKGKPRTIVIESYAVDVPQGNTKEDTCLLVDTINKSNAPHHYTLFLIFLEATPVFEDLFILFLVGYTV